MKLASLDDGTKNGLPVVVSRDLSLCTPATPIVGSLAEGLDRWDRLSDRLRGLCSRLERGLVQAWRFHPSHALAPIPFVERPNGESVALHPPCSANIGARSGFSRARLEGQALTGRAGRPRLIVLTAVLESTRSSYGPAAVTLCSPVVLTIDELDEVDVPGQPVVGRLLRDRDGEVEEVSRTAGRGLELPKSVGSGDGPRIVPVEGLNDLGMIGLREGDRFRASVTDSRRRGIAGTIDGSIEAELAS